MSEANYKYLVKVRTAHPVVASNFSAGLAFYYVTVMRAAMTAMVASLSP